MTTDRRGSDAELLERIHKLRSILPAMPAEVAIARRASRDHDAGLGAGQDICCVGGDDRLRAGRLQRAVGARTPLSCCSMCTAW